jgi:cysteine desulfurase family protein (TIGR01976 family)
MLDVAFARQQFPALASGWALFDNAGGTVPPRQVIERVTAYLSGYGVQLGASYALSAEATELVARGRAAAASLIGAAPDEILLGGSTTINTFVLARAIALWFGPGDEIVVTDLDHESNIGAWRRMAEERGSIVREWRARPETAALELEDLELLLSERTKLVCFTQCANVVGRIHDAAGAIARIHAAGAKALVDGVAFAPHRRVDVKALDADFYLVSLYKIFGPHVGVLYGKKEHLRAARGVNHFFFGEQDVPYKLQPGNVNHELVASLPGIQALLDDVYRHHQPGGAADENGRRQAAFDLFEQHEEALAERLLGYLRQHPRVRILGPTTADRRERVAIVAFTVPGRRASEIPAALDAQKLAVRDGHFYAHRAMDHFGLLASGGVVRASFAHYNTLEEADRLVAALDRVL